MSSVGSTGSLSPPPSATPSEEELDIDFEDRQTHEVNSPSGSVDEQDDSDSEIIVDVDVDALKNDYDDDEDLEEENEPDVTITRIPAPSANHAVEDQERELSSSPAALRIGVVPGIVDENSSGSRIVATRDDWFASSEQLAWTISKIGVYNPVLKVFKCSDCESCVGFLARVAEHWLGTHANMRVFQCPRCPYNSAWARCVRMHYTRAHEPHGDLPEAVMWKSSPVLVEVDRVLSSLKADVEASVVSVPSPTPPKRFNSNTARNGDSQRPAGNGNRSTSKSRSRRRPVPDTSDSSQATTPDHQSLQLVRKYACSYCAYSTDRRDLYTRHENIHKEEKPFVCFVCSKQFNRADHVKKHFLRIHPDAVYDIKKIRRNKGGNGTATLMTGTPSGGHEDEGEEVKSDNTSPGKISSNGVVGKRKFQLYPGNDAGNKVNIPATLSTGFVVNGLKYHHPMILSAQQPPHIVFPSLLRLPAPATGGVLHQLHHLPLQLPLGHVPPGLAMPLRISVPANHRPPVPDLILMSDAGQKTSQETVQWHHQSPYPVEGLKTDDDANTSPKKMSSQTLSTSAPHDQETTLLSPQDYEEQPLSFNTLKAISKSELSRTAKHPKPAAGRNSPTFSITPSENSEGSSSPVNGDSNNNHQQNNKKYFCSFCPWAGVDSWCLKRHLNTHVKPYTCPLCDYKAARMERLQLHVGRVHAKKICSKCSVLFDDQADLDKHVDEEQLGQRPPKINCQECGAAVESRSALESHMIIVHHGSLLKCPDCDFCTADPRTLDSHRIDRHSNPIAHDGDDIQVKIEEDLEENSDQSGLRTSEKSVGAGTWSGHSLLLYQQALSSLALSPNVTVTFPPGLPALSGISQDAVSSAEEAGYDDEDSKQLVINKRRKQDCPKKVLDDASSDMSRAGFKKILHCNQCDERFSEQSGLALHKLSVHKKRHSVEDDDRRSMSPEPAAKRRKPTQSATSSSGDKFKCGECGLRFPKFALLLKHLEDVPNCSIPGNN